MCANYHHADGRFTHAATQEPYLVATDVPFLAQLKMPSAIDVAKRALVVVTRALAVAYGFNPSVSRDSTDAQVRTSFRVAARRVHPDKGGTSVDAARLNDAKAAWDDALKNKTKVGRPHRGAAHGRPSSARASVANGGTLVVHM